MNDDKDANDDLIRSGKNKICIYRMKSDFVRIYFVEFCFTPDFRSLTANGVQMHIFTTTQAMIIGIMVESLELGHLSVPQQTILERIVTENGNTLLRSYFKGHAAWGTLIKSTGGRDASVSLDFKCLI